MNLEDCAAVLAKCAAFDRRTVGDSDILAWYEVLAPVELADALKAVTRWYANNRDWIMPSDVRRIAHDVWRERIDEQRIVPQITPPEHLVPLTDRSAEILEFVRGVRDALPPGRPELIRRPRITDPRRGRRNA